MKKVISLYLVVVLIFAHFNFTFSLAANETLFSDDFEDGEFTSQWRNLGGTWNIISDAGNVLNQSKESNAYIFPKDQKSWNDFTVETDISVSSFNGGSVLLCGRYTDLDNYYFVEITSTNITLNKQVNGKSTLLRSKSYPFLTDTWYTLKVSLAGSRLDMYVNNVYAGGISEESLTSGSICLISKKAVVNFDNVVVKGEVVAPTLTPSEAPKETPTDMPIPSNTNTPTPSPTLATNVTPESTPTPVASTITPSTSLTPTITPSPTTTVMPGYDLVNYDFENDYTTTKLSSDFTQYKAGGTIELQTLTDSTKAVSLNDTSTSYYVELSKTFTELTGKSGLEFKFMQKDKKSPFKVRLGNSYSDYTISFETSDSGNLLVSYLNGDDSTILTDYSLDTWYKISMVVNTSTYKAEIYINDVLKKNNISFAKNMSSIKSFQIRSADDYTGNTIIDNLRISSTSAEPSPSPTPTSAGKPIIALDNTNYTIDLNTTSSLLIGGSITDDSTNFSIYWSQISGPSTCTLQNYTSSNPTIKFVEAGYYKFKVKVNDFVNDSVDATVNVTVNGSITLTPTPIFTITPTPTLITATPTIVINNPYASRKQGGGAGGAILGDLFTIKSQLSAVTTEEKTTLIQLASSKVIEHIDSINTFESAEDNSDLLRELNDTIKSIAITCTNMTDATVITEAINSYNSILDKLAISCPNSQSKELTETYLNLASVVAQSTALILENSQDKAQAVNSISTIVSKISSIISLSRHPSIEIKNLNDEVLKLGDAIFGNSLRINISRDLQNNVLIIDKTSFNIAAIASTSAALDPFVTSFNQNIKTSGLSGSYMKKLVINITSNALYEEFLVMLPSELLTSLKDSNINNIQIESKIGNVIIPSSFIAIPKDGHLDISMISGSKVLKPAHFEQYNFYDFNIVAVNPEGTKKSDLQYNGRVTLKLPYSHTQEESIDSITVFLLSNDNSSTNMSAIYNEVEALTQFEPQTSGKYYIKNASANFSDLAAKHWAAKYISPLAAKGIVSGTDKIPNFKPNDPITRAAFAKLIVSAMGIYDENATSTFSDISPKAWYYKYVSSAAKSGIIAGKSDGSFGPNDVITRQDMAVMVSRILKETGNININIFVNFSDNSSISNYAKEPIARVVRYGLMSGKPGNTMDPKGTATRAEAATVIYKVLNSLK